MIKQSRIKEVVSVKPYEGKHGTTYYYNLILENGDKINIGKKNRQKPGYSITYEIVEEGQQEYNKAKSSQGEPYKPNKAADNTKGIEVGHAINNAVNLLCAGVELEIDDRVLSNEHKIYYYAKKIMLISEKLKNE